MDNLILIFMLPFLLILQLMINVIDVIKWLITWPFRKRIKKILINKSTTQDMHIPDWMCDMVVAPTGTNYYEEESRETTGGGFVEI